MKPSLRSMFYLLIVPMVGVLIALVLAALVPFFAMQADIRKVQVDLAHTDAVREFGSAFTEATRAYANFLVTGKQEEEAEINVAHERARVTLHKWREAALQGASGEVAIVDRVSILHEEVIVTGQRVRSLVHAGRVAEAAATMARDLDPTAESITRAVDENLLDHRKRITVGIARIDGGIHYAGILPLGALHEVVDDLGVNVTNVLETSALRESIEREIRGYWYACLGGNDRELADIAVNRQRAKDSLLAWRRVADTATTASMVAQAPRTLRLASEIERDYRLIQKDGDTVIRQIGAGSMNEAKALLEASLEFQRMPVALKLRRYTNESMNLAAGNLANLQREAGRIRVLLIAWSAFLLLLAIGVPWILSRQMIRPLVNLQLAAERIGSGDLQTDVVVPSIREMADLANTFNQMVRDLRLSRESLQRSEERFHLASRATNDVIWEYDLVKQTVWASELDARYPQTDDGRVMVTAWGDLIHPDDSERVLAGHRLALESDAQYWSAEYRQRRDDGTYAFLFGRAWIARDAAGKAARMIGATTDVSERKSAEQAIAALNRQKEMILNSVGDGILGLDANGVVISANPAAAETLRSTVEELTGRFMREIVQRKGGVTGEQWDESAISHTLAAGVLERSDEESFLRADGSAFPVDYTSNAMYDETGSVVGAVVTFRDITQKQEIDRIKSQFVATVSHELRTPLTSIRGALGLLRSGMVGTIGEKGQRMLEIAVSNTDRLVRLINDILDIERLDSGQVALERKEIDVFDLVQQAVETMKAMADKADVAIEIRPHHATIAVDTDRVIQTLTNLISNAIKFSPRGTTIVVGCQRVEGALRISVSDQGRGIPADKLETIFERFQQVDASDSRDKGGTGLGLSICRSIVQQHGGKLWAESVFGEGSTFHFTIPIANEELLQGVTAGRTILVCDDDASVRQILKELLESRGYDVITADCGRRAIELAVQARPRAILLDLIMPDMNGWEVLAALKQSPETADLPILVASVLTAAEGTMMARSHVDLISGWIQKPLDESHLFATLERVAGRSTPAPKILLVEDDHDLARVLRTTFESKGVTVFHASNGFEAIELTRDLRPDLLVLDVSLPHVNGFDVVKWLRRDPNLRHVPVVVYSGDEVPQMQRFRLELGATEFFTKSRIAPEEFEQKVMQLLAAIVDAQSHNAAEVAHVEARAAH